MLFLSFQAIEFSDGTIHRTVEDIWKKEEVEDKEFWDEMIQVDSGVRWELRS